MLLVFEDFLLLFSVFAYFELLDLFHDSLVVFCRQLLIILLLSEFLHNLLILE
jgi:hypothetical protein